MKIVSHFEGVAKNFVDTSHRELKIKPRCFGIIYAEILTEALLVDLQERKDFQTLVGMRISWSLWP